MAQFEVSFNDVTQQFGVVITGIGPQGPAGPAGKDAELEPTGVEAGTYGAINFNGPYPSIYNIPTITVDEYGRVTGASNSVLPYASAESDGYITAGDYKKLGFVQSNKAPYTRIISAGNTETSSYVGVIIASNTDGTTPDISPVTFYAEGEYTDADGSTWIIPVNYKVKKEIVAKSSTITLYYWIYVTIPEPLEYDITVRVYCNHAMNTYM